MALKKSDLRAILKNEDSSSEEKISEILNILHDEVDTVKDEKDAIKQELTEAKAELAEAQKSKGEDSDGWKAKYEAISKEYDEYKAGELAKETRAAQEKAFVDALKEAGVTEKMLGVISDTKTADAIISAIKFDKDGKAEGVEELTEKLKTEYAEYIGTQETKGAATVKPPTNSGHAMTKEEIRAIKDTAERQKAIAENHELFGF